MVIFTMTNSSHIELSEHLSLLVSVIYSHKFTTATPEYHLLLRSSKNSHTHAEDSPWGAI